MKSIVLVFLISCICLLSGCSISPKEIDYGNDACHYCQMTIVDKIHGAEVVTNKGKVYKFDAAECMIHFIKDFDTDKIGLYLSNTYTDPTVLTDANTATFIVSESIPSPMGEYITAFKNKEDAQIVLNLKGGEMYTWQEIIEKIK